MNTSILFVCSCRPLFLSLTRVFSILPFTYSERALVDCTLDECANLVVWARSLARTVCFLETSPAYSHFFKIFLEQYTILHDSSFYTKEDVVLFIEKYV